MDGKGSWRDNVFVDRLRRSIKYEEVYLKAYESVTEASRRLGPTSTSITRGGLIPTLKAYHRIGSTITIYHIPWL